VKFDTDFGNGYVLSSDFGNNDKKTILINIFSFNEKHHL